MNTRFSLTPLALLLLNLACGRQGSPLAPAPPAVQVHLAPDAQGVDAGWIAATLSATRRATLSTRVAASVRRVHVHEGQAVAAGALLVSLRDEDLQAGLRAAEAAEEAAAAYHHRIEALVAQRAAIPAEMDQARTQLAQARAAVSQMQASLAYTRIRAPFAGVIQSRMVTEGAFVGPGAPLVELEGQGDLELVGSVSGAEGLGLRIGQKLAFEADGTSGLAVLTALAPGGDEASHRGVLRARVQTRIQGASGLRTGSFARLKLPGAAREGSTLSVPASALLQRGGLNGVFVARDGLAELHWLSLGSPQGDRFPVRAGLEPGDLVIDEPGALKDGQPVEVRR